MTKTLFKVPVGDWSKDGHNQSIDYYVYCNYPVEQMRQAYKDTCKKIGLQMNHSDNYTGLTNLKFRDPRCLLAEYEEPSISEEYVEILLEHGFDFARVDGERDDDDNYILQEAYFDSEGVLDLFMWFVSYSMPGDFVWEEYKIEAEPIVGYWCDGLNHQIGYGVFE